MPTTNPAKRLFGDMCAVKIEDSGRTVREVAKTIPNTPSTQFTRWKKGLWTYIPADKLEQICKTVCPDDFRGQLDLITAYLTDLTPGCYRPSLLIGQKGENEGMGLKPLVGPGSNWSEEMRQRLDSVAAAYLLDDEFANMVNQLSAWGKRIVKERGHKAD